jgi:hypothetical protein
MGFPHSMGCFPCNFQVFMDDFDDAILRYVVNVLGIYFSISYVSLFT